MPGQTAAAVTQAITDPLTHKCFSVFLAIAVPALMTAVWVAMGREGVASVPLALLETSAVKLVAAALKELWMAPVNAMATVPARVRPVTLERSAV